MVSWWVKNYACTLLQGCVLYQSRKYLPVLTWKVVTERLAVSCIPLGAQKEVTAQHQAEAHSDWSEQQRCVDRGPQDTGSAGYVGVPGAQELGLL